MKANHAHLRIPRGNPLLVEFRDTAAKDQPLPEAVATCLGMRVYHMVRNGLSNRKVDFYLVPR